jgi:hypothetical protein
MKKKKINVTIKKVLFLSVNNEIVINPLLTMSPKRFIDTKIYNNSSILKERSMR